MSSQLVNERAFLGNALHAPRRGDLELLRDTLIVIDRDGRIASVHTQPSPARERLVQRLTADHALVRLRADQYLLPGLVDLHIHAPQWPQLGKALELPLEEWLQKHTFPLEARYADTAFAQSVYRELVTALLANGTTTAVYFASLHLPATQILADVCLAKSQRALIGRVAMDDAQLCPAYYRDASAQHAVEETRAFIEYVRALPGNHARLIQAVITPRFIPACSDELLRRLGELAAESGCHIQTHCSESDWEHEFVLHRCGCTDTKALEGFGLLSRRSILAHGNFLTDADLATLVERGAVVAHCPLSNVYFSDAVFPLRRALAQGLHVGLGTDIAGGASPSILENVRQAVIASRMLESGVDAHQSRGARRRPHSRVDLPTAFWLATAGGGLALNLPVGLFREGFEFDSLLIDAGAPDSNLRIDGPDTPHEILQKIVYHAARANIRTVWVGGRCVHGQEPGG
ncbi:MAG TPA: guanine deaminase [Steroidobacteraceae bacterium]|jgi:guanine deaminase